MPESRAADQWRPAVLTAVGSAVVCIALAAFAVTATGVTISTLDLVRSAVRVWLVAVGATVTDGDTHLDLVPIGATIVVIAVVFVVTKLVLRTPILDPGAFGAMTGGVAGLLAGVCSALTSTDAHSTSFVRATFGAFVVVGLPAAFGATRRSRIAWLGLSPRWTPVANGAATGVTGLLGGATVVTMLLLVTHLERAADLWATLDPGGVGVLGLLNVLAFPTLVLWTTAVILGPGFTIGPDTSVDLAGSALGAVPGFPALAGLPDPGPFPSIVVLLPLIPLLAGVAAGLVSHARTPAAQRTWGRVILDGATAGAVAGLVVGLLIETARGAVGSGLMTSVGPPAWQSLLVAVPLMATGAALGATGAHYRSDRDRSAS